MLPLGCRTQLPEYLGTDKYRICLTNSTVNGRAAALKPWYVVVGDKLISAVPPCSASARPYLCPGNASTQARCKPAALCMALHHVLLKAFHDEPEILILL